MKPSGKKRKPKRRPESPTFIHELPLKAAPSDQRILEVRLDQTRMLYNACLQEGLRRMDLMRESKAWRRARKSRDKTERATLFRKLRKEHGFTDYALESFAVKTKNACSIGDHLNTHVCQKIATRAFKAVQEYMFGSRGSPRFKGRNRIHSIEDKSNESGIRWRDGKVEWNGLTIQAVFDHKDKHGVEAHALASKVKYLRLVRRTVKGRIRWFVQLVLEGTPKLKAKNTIGTGDVGLDIGPSSIAAVSDNDAVLEAFCAELEPIHERVKAIQRALDRSRRAMNPDNYLPNGTVKPGPRTWKVSQRYINLKQELAEAHRVLAETRNRLHGRQANRVLAMSNHIKLEKLSYKSLQRNYGKSVSFRAPGMFVEKLTRKAASASGSVIAFLAHRHRLSQLCHCGTLRKKSLSARWHECQCGIGQVQRDLYSAYLAKHVTDDGLTLDMRQAVNAWPGAQPLLERAMARVEHQAANGRFTPSSFGLRRQSRSPVKDGSTPTEAVDAVGEVITLPESRGEVGGTAVRTPCL